MTVGCLADSTGAGPCGGVVDDAAPVRLCPRHLAAAAEWAAIADGATDVLPAPCRLCGARLGVRYPSGWLCAVCEWRHGDIVDGELPPPRVDVVYYLRFGDRVKIGTSANPRQRFAAILHDDVLAFERGDRRLESRRHTRFAADRFPGTEWFVLSEPILAHVRTLGGGAQDPWDLLALWRSEAVASRG
ncbi:GIY-YIG nuclease family protein [Microbacterium sp. P01]|uniref:GIY-YIG nuclease family protein n=1 Tax=unclassified Microbacterium TaxID=2609290 RepID=UPI00366CBB88